MSGRRSLAQKLGLSIEQTQGLIDSDFAAKAALREQWQNEIKSDANLAGPQFEQKRDQGRAAVVRFGGTELLDVLDKTGLGDFPPFMRFITKLGAAMGEPRHADTGDPVPAKKDVLREMFDKSPGLFTANAKA